MSTSDYEGRIRGLIAEREALNRKIQRNAMASFVLSIVSCVFAVIALVSLIYARLG
jgi:hypothetical protein